MDQQQTNIGSHISRRFDVELEDVRNRVLAMGGLVEQQLANAVRALIDCDAGMAEEVVRNDHRVNAMEVAIDEECTHILARRQPAASDLRLVLAVVKTITDLERIGDEVERIARFTGHMAREENCRYNLGNNMEHMAETVRKMLHDALDAFARMDIEVALSVARADRRVDREYESITRQCITYMMQDPRSIPVVLDSLWCARSLERIGDRCCNIGEYVIYFVKGRDVRHTSLEQLEAAAGLSGGESG